jgi:thymidylate synthase (FAD)
MGQLENTVELLGYYGSDETIACSAWTSTSREMTDDKRQRVGKLIDMLWSNSHQTPFEKGMVHFLVNTDIATHIQIIKHRIGVSVNAESARYKELKEDKYFLPEDWKGIRISDNGEALNTPSDDWHQRLAEYTEEGNRLYHACLADLEPVLGRKRAKESARFFKTYNSQIQADVSFNMRSFANFVKLRRCSHSQLEIRKVADEMLKLVMDLPDNPFEHTLKAWEKSGIIKDI